MVAVVTRRRCSDAASLTADSTVCTRPPAVAVADVNTMLAQSILRSLPRRFFSYCARKQRWRRQLGDAESSLGDPKSSLGDAESSLGDAESSLGDAESSLGDG
jgi:hypothetical protein